MKNKIVLITGSSDGIGKETALLFAHEKAQVIVTYNKDKKAGEKVEEECKQLGASKTLLIKLDIKSNSDIRDACREIKEKFGYVDILINNAGIISWENLADQSLDEIENQIRTNLEGTIKVTRMFLDLVKSTIINIASGAGQEGYGGLSVYSATKFGIRGFSQALAMELEHLQIYVVNPGMTATKMTGYRGIPAVRVAAIILNTATGKYKVESGGDINVWDCEE